LTSATGQGSLARVRRRPRTPLPPGFGTIWLSVAIDLVGFGIVLPLLPLYAEDFGASPFTIGLLVATYSLMQLVFSPVWGRVSDRVGRKPVLVISLAGSAVGSLLIGLAPSLWVLFLGRVVDGVSGASVSVAQAAVTDVASPGERARLLGLLGAAFGLGFVAGPAIGGLAALGDPALPFLIAAAIAAVNAFVAVRRLPETNPRAARGVAGRRAGATTAAGETPAAGIETIGGRLLSPGILRLIVVAFLALVAFSGFEATFSLLGERRFGLTLASTGAVFAALGLVLVGVQGGLIHPVVSRWGEVAALRAGLVLDGAGLALLAGATTWPVLVAALFLLVVGQGLVTPTLSSLVAGRARGDRRGSVLGVQQSAGALARVVGPVAGGWLFQHVGLGAPYVVGAGLALVALALTLGERTGAGPVPQEAVVGS
jgi:MFS transporter, DHA1 family, tetracycline resistance protein